VQFKDLFLELFQNVFALVSRRAMAQSFDEAVYLARRSVRRARRPRGLRRLYHARLTQNLIDGRPEEVDVNRLLKADIRPGGFGFHQDHRAAPADDYDGRRLDRLVLPNARYEVQPAFAGKYYIRDY
jgi:hypothetical protein